MVAANRRSGAIWGVAFSPDGSRIVTASTDKVVHLFDADDGREIVTLLPGNTGTSAVAFSPDGVSLAAAAGDSTVQIWDAPLKHENTILGGHADAVTNVTFSPDCSRIYSESESEKRVWDFATLQTLPDATWEQPEVLTHSSRDGRWFLTTEFNNIVLVDLEYKNSPDEDARRKAKANFDPFWHRDQATAATAAKNWYGATFHFLILVKYDPGQEAFQDGLQSSFQQLESQTAAEGRQINSQLEKAVRESLMILPSDEQAHSGL
jgi:hypothetical protein